MTNLLLNQISRKLENVTTRISNLVLSLRTPGNKSVGVDKTASNASRSNIKRTLVNQNIYKLTLRLISHLHKLKEMINSREAHLVNAQMETMNFFSASVPTQVVSPTRLHKMLVQLRLHSSGRPISNRSALSVNMSLYEPSSMVVNRIDTPRLQSSPVQLDASPLQNVTLDTTVRSTANMLTSVKAVTSHSDTSEIFTYVTFRGGIEAGVFTAEGKVENMSKCVTLCYNRSSCHVAYMVENLCYSIKCYSYRTCEILPVSSPIVHTQVVYIKSRIAKLPQETLTNTTIDNFMANFTTANLQSCKLNSTVLRNVTFKGGIRAGNFTDHGQVGSIDTCSRICCSQKKCDAAFMVFTNCFTIDCFSANDCKAVPSKSRKINTTIEYFDKTFYNGSEGNLSESLENNKINQEETFSCPILGEAHHGVTFNGGLTAGNFTDHGETSSMISCINKCCKSSKCDVAFMIERNCYSVECAENVRRCLPITARATQFKTVMAFMEKDKFGILNLTSTSQRSSCTVSPRIERNVTFRGGLNAGKFTEYGKVNDMETCVGICCNKSGCDAAFTVDNICFTVKCSPYRKLCETVPARRSKYNLEIAFVKKTQSIINKTQAAKRQFVFSDITNGSCEATHEFKGVNLTGGWAAGKFLRYPQINSLEDCVNHCCIYSGCNAGFILNQHCYNLHCFSRDLCKFAPTSNMPMITRIVFLHKRSNQDGSTLLLTNPFSTTQEKTSSLLLSPRLTQTPISSSLVPLSRPNGDAVPSYDSTLTVSANLRQEGLSVELSVTPNNISRRHSYSNIMQNIKFRSMASESVDGMSIDFVTAVKGSLHTNSSVMIKIINTTASWHTVPTESLSSDVQRQMLHTSTAASQQYPGHPRLNPTSTPSHTGDVKPTPRLRFTDTHSQPLTYEQRLLKTTESDWFIKNVAGKRRNIITVPPLVNPGPHLEPLQLNSPQTQTIAKLYTPNMRSPYTEEGVRAQLSTVNLTPMAFEQEPTFPFRDKQLTITTALNSAALNVQVKPFEPGVVPTSAEAWFQNKTLGKKEQSTKVTITKFPFSASGRTPLQHQLKTSVVHASPEYSLHKVKEGGSSFQSYTEIATKRFSYVAVSMSALEKNVLGSAERSVKKTNTIEIQTGKRSRTEKIVTYSTAFKIYISDFNVSVAKTQALKADGIKRETSFLAAHENIQFREEISKNSDYACAHTFIAENATLRGGLEAGDFESRANISNIEDCLTLCCQTSECNAAVISNNTCFLVACFNEKPCEAVPARNNTNIQQLGYVARNKMESDIIRRLLNNTKLSTSPTTKWKSSVNLPTDGIKVHIPTSKIKNTTCRRSPLLTGARFAFGMRAGEFQFSGKVGHPGDCVELCCASHECNAVFMLRSRCYLVACYNQVRCRSVAAKSTFFRPTIVYVARDGNEEFYISDMMSPELLKRFANDSNNKTRQSKPLFESSHGESFGLSPSRLLIQGIVSSKTPSMLPTSTAVRLGKTSLVESHSSLVSLSTSKIPHLNNSRKTAFKSSHIAANTAAVGAIRRVYKVTAPTKIDRSIATEPITKNTLSSSTLQLINVKSTLDKGTVFAGETLPLISSSTSKLSSTTPAASLILVQRHSSVIEESFTKFRTLSDNKTLQLHNVEGKENIRNNEAAPEFSPVAGTNATTLETYRTHPSRDITVHAAISQDVEQSTTVKMQSKRSVATITSQVSTSHKYVGIETSVQLFSLEHRENQTPSTASRLVVTRPSQTIPELQIKRNLPRTPFLPSYVNEHKKYMENVPERKAVTKLEEEINFLSLKQNQTSSSLDFAEKLISSLRSYINNVTRKQEHNQRNYDKQATQWKNNFTAKPTIHINKIIKQLSAKFPEVPAFQNLNNTVINLVTNTSKANAQFQLWKQVLLNIQKSLGDAELSSRQASRESPSREDKNIGTEKVIRPTNSVPFQNNLGNTFVGSSNGSRRFQASSSLGRNILKSSLASSSNTVRTSILHYQASALAQMGNVKLKNVAQRSSIVSKFSEINNVNLQLFTGNPPHQSLSSTKKPDSSAIKVKTTQSFSSSSYSTTEAHKSVALADRLMDLNLRDATKNPEKPVGIFKYLSDIVKSIRGLLSSKRFHKTVSFDSKIPAASNTLLEDARTMNKGVFNVMITKRGMESYSGEITVYPSPSLSAPTRTNLPHVLATPTPSSITSNPNQSQSLLVKTNREDATSVDHTKHQDHQYLPLSSSYRSTLRRRSKEIVSTFEPKVVLPLHTINTFESTSARKYDKQGTPTAKASTKTLKEFHGQNELARALEPLQEQTSNVSGQQQQVLCNHSRTYENQTLRGGIGAGIFNDTEKVKDITDCVRLCCSTRKCDLAFLLIDRCFLVTCFSKSQCRPVPAKSLRFHPKIAFVHKQENLPLNAQREVNDLPEEKRRLSLEYLNTSVKPSGKSNANASAKLSTKPSAKPSANASTNANAKPGAKPSTKPGAKPSSNASAKPSSNASAEPSSKASAEQSEKPVAKASSNASGKPSSNASAKASSNASAEPSSNASAEQSEKPGAKPSSNASAEQSEKPGAKPSSNASAKPSSNASVESSSNASAEQSEKPGAKPSSNASAEQSEKPGAKPSSNVSGKPSSNASAKASSNASAEPSSNANAEQSEKPGAKPSSYASAEQSEKPGAKPSSNANVNVSANANTSEKPNAERRANASAKPDEKSGAKQIAEPSEKSLLNASSNLGKKPSKKPPLHFLHLNLASSSQEMTTLQAKDSVSQQNSCTTISVHHNTTLQGGIGAGVFDDKGKVISMEKCIELCCKEKNCSLAFKIRNNCYTVICYNEKLCRSVPVHNVNIQPLIAYVARGNQLDMPGTYSTETTKTKKYFGGATLTTTLKVAKIQASTSLISTSMGTVTLQIRCQASDQEIGVTLRGGLSSGMFEEFGKVDNVSKCVNACCNHINCDVAFVVQSKCYLVACFHQRLCESVPAKNQRFHPTIVHVRKKLRGPDLKTFLNIVQPSATVEAGRIVMTVSKSPLKSTQVAQISTESTSNAKEKKLPEFAAALAPKDDIQYPASNVVLYRDYSNTIHNNVVFTPPAGSPVDFLSSNLILLQDKTNKKETKQLIQPSSMSTISAEVLKIARNLPNTGLTPSLTEKVTLVNSSSLLVNVKKIQNERKSFNVSEDSSTARTCKTVNVFYNVTVHGGINAGVFRDQGLVKDMPSCIHRCCGWKLCTVALMLISRCFLISCKNEQSCRPVQAQSFKIQPSIAFISRQKRLDVVTKNLTVYPTSFLKSSTLQERMLTTKLTSVLPSFTPISIIGDQLKTHITSAVSPTSTSDVQKTNRSKASILFISAQRTTSTTKTLPVTPIKQTSHHVKTKVKKTDVAKLRNAENNYNGTTQPKNRLQDNAEEPLIKHSSNNFLLALREYLQPAELPQQKAKKKIRNKQLTGRSKMTKTIALGYSRKANKPTSSSQFSGNFKRQRLPHKSYADGKPEKVKHYGLKKKAKVKHSGKGLKGEPVKDLHHKVLEVTHSSKHKEITPTHYLFGLESDASGVNISNIDYHSNSRNKPKTQKSGNNKNTRPNTRSYNLKIFDHFSDQKTRIVQLKQRKLPRVMHNNGNANKEPVDASGEQVSGQYFENIADFSKSSIEEDANYSGIKQNNKKTSSLNINSLYSGESGDEVGGYDFDLKTDTYMDRKLPHVPTTNKQTSDLEDSRIKSADARAVKQLRKAAKNIKHDEHNKIVHARKSNDSHSTKHVKKKDRQVLHHIFLNLKSGSSFALKRKLNTTDETRIQESTVHLNGKVNSTAVSDNDTILPVSKDWHSQKPLVLNMSAQHRAGKSSFSKGLEPTSILPSTPPTSSTPSPCLNSPISYNVTLQNGIRSGSFRDQGRVGRMGECIRKCCEARDCDVAFMLKDSCYLVTCFTKKGCDSVPVRHSSFQPRLAHMMREDDLMSFIDEQGTENVSHPLKIQPLSTYKPVQNVATPTSPSALPASITTLASQGVMNLPRSSISKSSQEKEKDLRITEKKTASKINATTTLRRLNASRNINTNTRKQPNGIKVPLTTTMAEDKIGSRTGPTTEPVTGTASRSSREEFLKTVLSLRTPTVTTETPKLPQKVSKENKFNNTENKKGISKARTSITEHKTTAITNFNKSQTSNASRLAFVPQVTSLTSSHKTPVKSSAFELKEEKKKKLKLKNKERNKNQAQHRKNEAKIEHDNVQRSPKLLPGFSKTPLMHTLLDKKFTKDLNTKTQDTVKSSSNTGKTDNQTFRWHHNPKMGPETEKYVFISTVNSSVLVNTVKPRSDIPQPTAKTNITNYWTSRTPQDIKEHNMYSVERELYSRLTQNYGGTSTDGIKTAARKPNKLSALLRKEDQPSYLKDDPFTTTTNFAAGQVVSDNDNMTSCKLGATEYNYTLNGGIRAGLFNEVGKVKDIHACAHKCCASKICDVAFMILNRCYLVTCSKEKMCKSVKALASSFRPVLVRVSRKKTLQSLPTIQPQKTPTTTSTETLRKTTILNSHQPGCYPGKLQYNTTLWGGLHAGSFLDKGPTNTVEECSRLCCENRNCNIVFYLFKHCHLVTCFDSYLCHSVPSQLEGFNPTIVHIMRDAKPELTNQTSSAQLQQSSTNSLNIDKPTQFKKLSDKPTYPASRKIKNKNGVHHKSSANVQKVLNVLGLSPNAQSNSKQTHKVCSHSNLYREVTLRKGFYAGKFTSHGKITRPKDCLDICCKENHCDLIFIYQNHCFTVKCHSSFACEIVQARPTTYKPMVAFVMRNKTKSGVKDKLSVSLFKPTVSPGPTPVNVVRIKEARPKWKKQNYGQSKTQPTHARASKVIKQDVVDLLKKLRSSSRLFSHKKISVGLRNILRRLDKSKHLHKKLHQRNHRIDKNYYEREMEVVLKQLAFVTENNRKLEREVKTLLHGGNKKTLLKKEKKRGNSDKQSRLETGKSVSESHITDYNESKLLKSKKQKNKNSTTSDSERNLKQSKSLSDSYKVVEKNKPTSAIAFEVNKVNHEVKEDKRVWMLLPVDKNDKTTLNSRLPTQRQPGTVSQETMILNHTGNQNRKHGTLVYKHVPLTGQLPDKALKQSRLVSLSPATKFTSSQNISNNNVSNENMVKNSLLRQTTTAAADVFETIDDNNASTRPTVARTDAAMHHGITPSDAVKQRKKVAAGERKEKQKHRVTAEDMQDNNNYHATARPSSHSAHQQTHTTKEEMKAQNNKNEKKINETIEEVIDDNFDSIAQAPTRKSTTYHEYRNPTNQKYSRAHDKEKKPIKVQQQTVKHTADVEEVVDDQFPTTSLTPTTHSMEHRKIQRSRYNSNRATPWNLEQIINTKTNSNEDQQSSEEDVRTSTTERTPTTHYSFHREIQTPPGKKKVIQQKTEKQHVIYKGETQQDKQLDEHFSDNVPSSTPAPVTSLGSKIRHKNVKRPVDKDKEDIDKPDVEETIDEDDLSTIAIPTTDSSVHHEIETLPGVRGQHLYGRRTQAIRLTEDNYRSTPSVSALFKSTPQSLASHDFSKPSRLKLNRKQHRIQRVYINPNEKEKNPEIVEEVIDDNVHKTNTKVPSQMYHARQRPTEKNIYEGHQHLGQRVKLIVKPLHGEAGVEEVVDDYIPTRKQNTIQQHIYRTHQRVRTDGNKQEGKQTITAHTEPVIQHKVLHPRTWNRGELLLKRIGELFNQLQDIYEVRAENKTVETSTVKSNSKHKNDTLPKFPTSGKELFHNAEKSNSPEKITTSPTPTTHFVGHREIARPVVNMTNSKHTEERGNESLYELVKDIYQQVQDLRKAKVEQRKHLNSSKVSTANHTAIAKNSTANHTSIPERTLNTTSAPQNKTEENAILLEVKTIFAEMKDLYDKTLLRRNNTEKPTVAFSNLGFNKVNSTDVVREKARLSTNSSREKGQSGNRKNMQTPNSDTESIGGKTDKQHTIHSLPSPDSQERNNNSFYKGK